MKEMIEPALSAVLFICGAAIAVTATVCFCLKLAQWILP